MVLGKKGKGFPPLTRIREYEDLKKELENIRAVLTIQNPFIASLLRRCEIIADTSVASSCVNVAGEIRINPQYLRSLTVSERVFEYGDMVLHIAFSHPQRMRGKDEKLFDFASHAATTAILRSHGFGEGPRGTITPEMVAKIIKKKPEEVISMSVEEIYHLLVKNLKENQSVPSKNDLSSKGTPSDGKDEGDSTEESSEDQGEKHQSDKRKNKNQKNEGGGTSQQNDGTSGNGNRQDGVVLQEGDPDAYDPQKTPEERQEFWKEAVANALVQARMAGKLPADLERLMDDLSRTQVDWKHIVRKEIQNGLGKNVVSTWNRPSRKHPMYPGIKHLTKPTVRFLTDTSGSIGIDELRQSISEAYHISKFVAFLKIYPWDAIAYEPIEVKKPRDVILRVKDIKGGGGTVIAPVLELVNAEMKRSDVVIIVSDGYISDLDSTKTQMLLARIAAKASVAVFATLAQNIKLPKRWKQVRIVV